MYNSLKQKVQSGASNFNTKIVFCNSLVKTIYVKQERVKGIKGQGDKQGKRGQENIMLSFPPIKRTGVPGEWGTFTQVCWKRPPSEQRGGATLGATSRHGRI
jgi:hypothetical protein